MIFLIRISNEDISVAAIDEENCMKRFFNHDFNRPYPKGFWLFTMYMDMYINRPSKMLRTEDGNIVRRDGIDNWIFVEADNAIDAVLKAIDIFGKVK